MGTITRSFANLITASGPSALPALGTITVDNIQLPSTAVASANANNLDDYEEGTWTPAFGLSSGSLTYSAQTGNYVKIGRQVTAVFYINVSASASGISDSDITGLPFTGSNTNYAGASFSTYGAPNNGTYFSDKCNILGLAAANSVIQLRVTTSATSAPNLITGATISAGSLLAGSITYFTT